MGMINQTNFTPQLKQEIITEIRRRLGDEVSCPLCHRGHWEIPDAFSQVPLLKNVFTGEPDSLLPSIAIICKRCGNTIYINLPMIGFLRNAPEAKAI
jgi:hypothetical protein